MTPALVVEPRDLGSGRQEFLLYAQAIDDREDDASEAAAADLADALEHLTDAVLTPHASDVEATDVALDDEAEPEPEPIILASID